MRRTHLAFLPPLTGQRRLLTIAVVDTLGDDLLLLSIRPRSGVLATAARINYGLMGSELVRLAASGRIEIRSDRVVVVDPTAVGDADLDAALEGLIRARRPPRAADWVGRPRSRIRKAYLERLVRSGVLRAEPRLLRGYRWIVVDQARVDRARASLDAIALSAGTVSTEQAAYGGLAGAVGLGRVLYPGLPGRTARKRLTEIGTGQWTVRAVTDAAAATRAAVDASTQAATGAAVHAAVHAATHAAVHAASHGGAGDGGGGHGGGHH